MVRLSQNPTTLLSLLSVILSSTHKSYANPYPRHIPFAEVLGSHVLSPRQCMNPCGYSGQLCCTSDQTCITDAAGQAQCGSGGGGGGGNVNIQGGAAQGGGDSGQWQYYTTTFVETDLITRVSTWSSYMGAATVLATQTSTYAPAMTGNGCNIPCGTICCAQGQSCAKAGQCVASGGYYSSYYNSYTSYSAPLRPTSGAAGTATAESAPTTTLAFGTPLGTATAVYGAGATTTNRGLSGGAIAGIVIGVIAGILFLLFICLTVCVGKGIGAIFGGRRRTKREETYVHEHHSGGGGGGSRPWYGAASQRPSRIETTNRKKKGMFGGFAPVAAGLGGLALALGLKRRHDRKKQSSYGSNSSYSSYSDYTSSSE
ncbi:MAG: hypothetical protein M1833_007135 [Piccolia ochrophora]|nr:MAG: hypothetical protein M1833_007135 [Piccolia ochrophora]